MPIPDSGVEATCAIAKARLASAGGVVVGLVFLEFFFLFFSAALAHFRTAATHLRAVIHLILWLDPLSIFSSAADTIKTRKARRGNITVRIRSSFES